MTNVFNVKLDTVEMNTLIVMYDYAFTKLSKEADDKQLSTMTNVMKRMLKAAEEYEGTYGPLPEGGLDE